MKRSIVWFKTDLRLHDNETLIKAIAQSDEVIPVYCFDDRHYQKTEFGFHKTGNFRANFILESVADLDANLRKLGSTLMILKGKPEIEIPKMVKEFSITKVFAKKEVSYEEKQTEGALEKELWLYKCSLETFSTSTLYHAEDLPFAIKEIPDVFTNFRKKVEKESSIREVFPMPNTIKSPAFESIKLPSLYQLGLADVHSDPRALLEFKGGETEAFNRLHHYFEETKAISNYKNTRNGMLGADYSSKFSAWLALGCISPRQIYTELKKYEFKNGANESTYWLVFELLWRDYFRFMMKKYSHKFFIQNGIKENVDTKTNHNTAIFHQWENGQTGNDFIDANMLELKLTGFMSNRGRQNVASYLCNDLKLDWRYGAAYFEQQLIDYDVCSNWGNWAYLAGVGNDPRADRYFNIEKQAKDYDPQRLYRDLWLKGDS